LIKSFFTIGIILSGIGFLFVVFGLLTAPIPCSLCTSASYAASYTDYAFGVPFAIVGLAILIWSFLSKNSKVSSTELTQEENLV